MNILVIQNRMGIGDMVIFLPFIQAIANKYNSPVTLLIKASTKAEEYTKNLNYIKKIIYLRRENKNDLHSGLSGFFNLKNEIKKYSFDKVFIFNSSLRYRLVCKIAGIKDIYQYPLFEKKEQHIIRAAQKLLEKINLQVASNPQIEINRSSIQIAIQKGDIGLDDAIDIREVKSTKIANQLLKVKKNKKLQKDQQNIQKQQQFKSQMEMQKQQAAMQMEMQKQQIESQMSGAYQTPTQR